MRTHRSLGGAKGLKAALSLPRNTALRSQKFKGQGERPRRPRESPNLGNRTSKRHGGPRQRTMMARNIADSCPAQLQERIAALARKIGHSPAQAQFESEYGIAVLQQVRRTFGSWNAAKALCGLSVRKANPRTTSSLVLESLAAFVREHGDLPLASDAQQPTRTPQIPSYEIILSGLGVKTWRAAMRTVIENLNIKSERYGSPMQRAG
jgi:hypothetical protein